MTLLSEDAGLWDRVFSEDPSRLRFVVRLAAAANGAVLDVGCATGSLCLLLRRRGIEIAGLDLNPHFVAHARTKDPTGDYFVGDMKSFSLDRRFRLLLCLGTTFSYNLSNAEIAAALARFRTHLLPGGRVVIDVLNAVAFAGPRPFRPVTFHRFTAAGFSATATIRHRLQLKAQTMTEQVTWRVRDCAPRRDPEERLRLFFPQELALHLKTAGFGSIELRDGYGRERRSFDGRRLIALATNPG